ncbi:undecaprenyl-phosphate glucose phosphotransferase [soil metagenome]
MLKERSQILQQSMFIADIGLIALAWISAWVVRFEFLTPPEWMPLTSYLTFLPAVVVIWSAVFLLSGLYQTRRAQRLPLVVFSVARAVALGVVASVVAMFFFRAFAFSRLHMLLFGIISSLLLVGLRVAIYASLRQARKRGRNLRRVLIVGAGRAGQRVARAFRLYPWMGFEVVGFLDDREKIFDPSTSSQIIPLGRISEVAETMDRMAADGRTVDMVYAALPLAATARLEEIAEALSTRHAHLCLVPDLFHLDILLHQRVSDLDGLPVIHLIDEAPWELSRFAKRAIDIAFSAGVLLILSPLFAVVAAAIKLSSPGPVFYRQQRMSLNGQCFDMIKFRSMPINAEAATGAKWAEPGEQRATRVGALLRRTSLDELPQFINVLLGDMSVVGPRPERPVFIEDFKDRVPRYMLRHRVKAGITGWAQVNGWRGSTSIEKRIEYDLYYIQNWSLAFDIKIMALTLVKGFVHEHAY